MEDDFTQEFITAFNHAMLYEVGKFWDPADPDVIAGRISTREQRRKVGYVNIPADRGGETKYGVAQKFNKQIAVRDLDLNGAMTFYFNEVWLKGKCDKLPFPLQIIHFDGCVNHGVSRASKILQNSVNSEPDGIIGNMTLNLIDSNPQHEIISKIADIREDFYDDIVARNSSQSIFLNGWKTRITEVEDFCLQQI